MSPRHITAAPALIGREPWPNDPTTKRPNQWPYRWAVTLTAYDHNPTDHGGRPIGAPLTVTYWTGCGLTKTVAGTERPTPPTVADVLHALITDAALTDEYADAAELAEGLGYIEQGAAGIRQAQQAWAEILALAPQLAALLGAPPHTFDPQAIGDAETWREPRTTRTTMDVDACRIPEEQR